MKKVFPKKQRKKKLLRRRVHIESQFVNSKN